MVNWYMKGQSDYISANFHMGFYIDHSGFAEGDYDTKVMETHGATSDPFMAFGVDTGPASWTYGQQQVEIGLLKSHRLKFDTTGSYKWIGPGQDDWALIEASGSAGNLGDLDDVVISGTPAENELLAWDTTSSKWINQTGGEAGLATTGDLHAEDHDNTHHTTNFHSETDGTGVVTVHSDITSVGSGIIITTLERDALHTIVVAGDLNHNDLANIDAGDIKHITATQLGNLHEIYTLEAHVLATTGPHTGSLPLTDLDSWVAGNIIIGGAADWEALVKGTSTYVLKMGATYPAWGQVGWTEVTGKPTEFTPISHNNDYHSTNYEPANANIQSHVTVSHEAANANIQSHVASPVTDAHHTLYTLEQHNNSFHSETYITQAAITTHTSNDTHASLTTHKTSSDHDGRYYTETEINNTLKEQSITFPVSPSEGDFHYDEDDDSLYRYNAEALAWVEVGTMGAIASEVDNLGNHVATQALNMNTFKINGVVDPTANQDAATMKYVRDEGIFFTASDDLIFSNDTERTRTAGGPSDYIKIKEVTCYIKGNIRVYWEHKGNSPCLGGWSKVYLNNVAKSSAFETGTTYTAFTYDIAVEVGDLLQIWSSAFYISGVPVAGPASARYMRIKYIEFTSTADY